MKEAHDLWVFAYGSLMWRPGFAYTQAVHASLVGWQRAFCIYSRYHRGSEGRLGLVLGLDRGGACEGLAFKVAAADVPQTLRYLREREQVISVYREALVPVTLRTPERPEVLALAFLVERAHPSYAGRLPLAEQARLIRGACGRSGSNIDYLTSTLDHLRELGIRERAIERLVGLVGAHVARGLIVGPSRPKAHHVIAHGCHRRRSKVRPLKREDVRRFGYRTVLGAR